MDWTAQIWPRLDAETEAKFEPASGFLLVNKRFADYMTSANRYGTAEVAESDQQLYSALNHETYHYFQTICTGYVYRYAFHVSVIVQEELTPERLGVNSPEVDWVPDIEQYEWFRDMQFGEAQVQKWKQNLSDDPILYAAIAPDL